VFGDNIQNMSCSQDSEYDFLCAGSKNHLNHDRRLYGRISSECTHVQKVGRLIYSNRRQNAIIEKVLSGMKQTMPEPGSEKNIHKKFSAS